MQATLKQLRRNTGAVFRAIRRGQRVLVTYRGKPVAQMTPLDDGKKVENTDLFGIWKDNGKVQSVEGYIEKIRRGRFA